MLLLETAMMTDLLHLRVGRYVYVMSWDMTTTQRLTDLFDIASRDASDRLVDHVEIMQPGQLLLRLPSHPPSRSSLLVVNYLELHLVPRILPLTSEYVFTTVHDGTCRWPHWAYISSQLQYRPRRDQSIQTGLLDLVIWQQCILWWLCRTAGKWCISTALSLFLAVAEYIEAVKDAVCYWHVSREFAKWIAGCDSTTL